MACGLVVAARWTEVDLSHNGFSIHIFQARSFFGFHHQTYQPEFTDHSTQQSRVVFQYALDIYVRLSEFRVQFPLSAPRDRRRRENGWGVSGLWVIVAWFVVGGLAG
jgi:hypothetical protein